MVCFGLCPECGQNLGEVYLFFTTAKNAYIQTFKDKNINIETVNIRENVIPDLNFIFEAIHIKNHCCKMHLLGDVDLDDHFGE